ncbi:hypothetical protein ASD24_09895 [Paenibacillus sp. Root52]|uniref:DUF7683 domain-containing protein n=1 Tax=Paenibacillus amylolyticus TaxID=1451 RepID=A0AAP5LQ47_PAEAM|nr:MULTISPECIES: hypothetical protein [Paenibacillus]KQY84092.1 hypothetical protein ASD24_09895 [Paenibacillus sp. Root52]MDR6726966.1 hypothetical protein [Paenibacillus amylolyticus]
MNYQWQVNNVLDGWTCPSEIGKVIQGNVFTLEQYLLVEDAYIDTIMAFLKEAGQQNLRVIQVLNRSISQEDQHSVLYEQEFSQIVIREDGVYNTDEIRTICKMILRNYADCQLYAKDHFFVHFGWDYYMFIGSYRDSYQAIEFARSKNLSVEKCTSPYYYEEKDVTRSIEWSEIDAEVEIVIGEEEIQDVTIQKYRDVFGLSEEHPVFGYFKITQAHQEFFQSKINHTLDFTKYRYGLRASC